MANKQAEVEEATDKFPWIVRADERWEWPEPSNGKKFTLDELREIVGGRIEMIRVPAAFSKRKMYMVVNEVGKLKGLPPNTLATTIMGQLIVGDVLLAYDGML
jgi:hypothetical protein